jgi:protocatechuate 3,4-dioxygenase, beta subunit
VHRRQLLQAGLAALLVPRRAWAECDWCGAPDAPANLGPIMTIAGEREPGARMVIAGTIFARDGKTPARGALLYAWHADAQGMYPPHPRGHRHGRLRGWLRTAADGRYEIRSIKPEPYPQGGVPAHIHATLSAPGVPERLIDEYWFTGDPYVTDGMRRDVERRDPGAIVALARDGKGVLRGVRDLKL